MEARKKEAAGAMAAGAKHEKVSLTKWKPDWENALVEYEHAATCFKGLKDFPNAALAFSKAGNAAYKCEILAAAGKHYESAGLMYRDGKDLATAAEMYERSASSYFEDGAIDRGADALVKGARVIEPASVERAGELFERAIAAWKEDEMKPVEFSLETYKAAVTFFLRTRQLERAVVALEEQLEAHAILKQANSAAKCVLSVVVAKLHSDDFAGAHAWLSELEFDLTRAEQMRQEEAAIARELLDAFGAQSEEMLAAAVAKRAFVYLDSQALKLARELTLRTAAVPVEYVNRGPGTAAPLLPPLPPPPGFDDDSEEQIGTMAAPAPRTQAQPQLGDFGEVVEDFGDDLT
mmetsp:Transcript_9275/g.23501  ORF Transcript_9275/g.23501 Transcript_9275/m.23501 type:complete len:349 (-) Transcript_9275:144-1190(-)